MKDWTLGLAFAVVRISSLVAVSGKVPSPRILPFTWKTTVISAAPSLDSSNWGQLWLTMLGSPPIRAQSSSVMCGAMGASSLRKSSTVDLATLSAF